MSKSKKNARRRAKKKAKAAEQEAYKKEQLRRFPQLADEPQRNVKMNGFRQGKVPDEMLERMAEKHGAEDDDDDFDDVPTSFMTGEGQ